jgi:hypothetical protein
MAGMRDPLFFSVIPAEAGIQISPAYAGDY